MILTRFFSSGIMLVVAGIIGTTGPTAPLAAAADAEDGGRKLSSAQTDAAAKIQQEVEAANSGVYGVALPLNYVHSTSSNTQQLTVGMKVAGANRVQQLLVDTGSSSLMFCDQSIATNNENVKTNYAQCNLYSGLEQCPNGVDKGSHNFWAGPVYQGDVTAYDTLNGEQEIDVMKDVPYVIAEKQQYYDCIAPIDGIFGIAYSAGGGNEAYVLPDGGAASDILDIACSIDDGTKKLAQCNVGNLSTTDLNSPIEQALRDDIESGYNLEEAFGMHVNYEATKGAAVNTVIPGLGIYYGGNVALNNSYYNGGTPQVAKSRFTNAPQSKAAYYDVNLLSMRLPKIASNSSSPKGFAYSSDFCEGDRLCIQDTGNSWLALPIPEEFCSDIKDNTWQSSDYDLGGNISIDLEGTDGSPTTLTFPLSFVVSEVKAGWVLCNGLNGDFTLGFPVFSYYYLVYNMANNTLIFVNLPPADTPPASKATHTIGGSNFGLMFIASSVVALLVSLV